MPSNGPYASLQLTEQTPTLRVSQALTLCNSILSELTLRIEGEIANFSLNRGKFVFFDLKDEQEESRLGCFMMAFNLSTPLENGMRVVIEGKPGLYQKSGQFRLTVNRVEPKGEGSVKRAFELLFKKLQEEGLFAIERKRQLPRYVQKVGIISSNDAAGYGDFKKIALSRLPGVTFYMASVAVQGNDAEAEICKAFDYLNGYYDLDAIVLIRGGGSAEDLHAFNSESVARAIVRSKAPVLVGVGHEKDITIADYSADVRASTPTNAAGLLLPTLEEVRDRILTLTQHGRRRVGQAISLKRERTTSLQSRIRQGILFSIKSHRSSTESLLRTIEAISPQNTLNRGYTLTTTAEGQPVTSVKATSPGQTIITRFSDGQSSSVIQ
jgi:exodeoxyribonuclease VII large subunit